MHARARVCVCVCVFVVYSLSRVQFFCYSKYYSPPGSSVHQIFQARILGFAISFSRASSPPRDQTHFACLSGGFFTTEPPGKPVCVCVCKKYYRLNSEALSPRSRFWQIGFLPRPLSLVCWWLLSHCVLM